MIHKFEFEKLDLKDAYLIKPFCADDVRGAFIKDYSKPLFEENGLTHNLCEIFYTVSHKGVVRAMHFQAIKQQAKLVRCIHGKVYDVIIDLRKNSPTFMKWQGFYLTGENMLELYVPEGFGHGYLVLEDSIISYKCNENFYAEGDGGIKWDDADMGIKWPVEELDCDVILADKDINLPSFKEWQKKENGGF